MQEELVESSGHLLQKGLAAGLQQFERLQHPALLVPLADEVLYVVVVRAGRGHLAEEVGQVQL